MRKYLPLENITYQTLLSSEEIIRRLAENIEPKKMIRLPSILGGASLKKYEGQITGNLFEISRILGYRNSFVPIIKGQVQKDNNRTIINVKMRMHLIVTVFILFWFSGVGIALISTLVLSFKNQRFEPVVLLPIAMILFLYILATAAFKYESKKSKEYLAELFEADIEKKINLLIERN